MVVPKSLPRDNEGRISPEIIDNLFAHSQHMDARVTGIEKSMASVVDKLDKIAIAVTTQAAIPQYKIADTLDIVSKASTLLVIAAGAIIFISTSISAGPVASLQARDAEYGQRMMRLEKAISRVEDQHMQYVLKVGQVTMHKPN